MIRDFIDKCVAEAVKIKEYTKRDTQKSKAQSKKITELDRKITRLNEKIDAWAQELQNRVVRLEDKQLAIEHGDDQFFEDLEKELEETNTNKPGALISRLQKL